MKLYVDASVILRIVVNAPKALSGWKAWSFPTSSALLQVECLRTLDRYQTSGELRPAEITAIAWRDRINEEVTFVTHDNALAAAAEAYHFPVLGA